MKISAHLEKVVVFDQRMYVGKGVVRKWMEGVTLKFGANAVKYAPKRTGYMASTIRAGVDQIAPRTLEGTISVDAPYALYVLRGTTGPIMSNRLWNTARALPDVPLGSLVYYRKKGEALKTPRRGMRLKFVGYDGRLHYEIAVRGQAANNFLLEAWNATARTHRSIRPVSIPSSVTSP